MPCTPLSSQFHLQCRIRTAVGQKKRDEGKPARWDKEGRGQGKRQVELLERKKGEQTQTILLE